jgi:hypothetical protein
MQDEGAELLFMREAEAGEARGGNQGGKEESEKLLLDIQAP